MKSLVSFLTLAIFSINLYAAGEIGSYNEVQARMANIREGKFLKEMSEDIKNDLLEPMVEFDNFTPVRSNLNKSVYFGAIMEGQFDPLSGLQFYKREALEFVKVLVDKGIDLNSNHYYLSGSGTRKVNAMALASGYCSDELINLFIKNGGDLNSDKSLWVRARNKSFSLKDGSQEQKKCLELSESLLEKSEVDLHVIYDLFARYPEMPHRNELSFGSNVPFEANFSPRTIEIFKNRFGVKGSMRPNGNDPADDWFNEFRGHMERPTGNSLDGRTKREDLARAWWAKQSEINKAWACYYSSFDEAMEFFFQAGIDMDWLITISRGNDWWATGFGAFAVYDFRSYCNSLK